MGWWDEFMDIAKTAGSVYYTLATNPEVRKKVAEQVVDTTINNPRSLGDTLVGATEVFTVLSGHNANDIPQTTRDIIRTAGNVIGGIESNLPGIGVLHSGLATATELAAGRDPAHLKDFAIETGLAFAPPVLGEAYNLLKNMSDLPATNAVIMKEVVAPPRMVPMRPRVPLIPDVRRVPPEPLAPKAEPRIPAEVPVPKPTSAKPPDISNTYELFGDLGKTKAESRAKFEPSQVSVLAPPAETRAYSRIERLGNISQSHQQELGSFAPRPIGMSRGAFIQEHQKLVKVLEKGKPSELKKEAKSQLAELRKVKRRKK